MDSEIVDKIRDMAVKAHGNRIFRADGEPPYLYYIENANGKLEAEFAKNPRHHVANDESAVTAFANRFAELGLPVAVWYSRDGVTAILDDGDQTRRHSVHLKLSLSVQINELLNQEKVASAKKQDELIRWLRTKFHGCLAPAGEIILNLRALRFVKSADTNANIQHGARNVSSTIAAQVTGRNAIPEDFEIDVPIFANAYQQLREKVTLIVDIDEAAETIKLIPAPGSIENAIANAESRIGNGLVQVLNPTPSDESDIIPQVYFGKP